MSEEVYLERVAWTREPGKWTLSHITADRESTLCGLAIPEADGVHDVKFEVGGKLCERCADKLRELEVKLEDR